jgi:hypothetical protein
MIANAIHTKWKFIVEFEDEETGAIAGTLGEAPDRDECQVMIEEEMEYQRLRGYIRVTAEAVELCEQCEGEGSIPVEDGIVSICDACGGHSLEFQARPRRRDGIHATASARSLLELVGSLLRSMDKRSGICPWINDAGFQSRPSEGTEVLLSGYRISTVICFRPGATAAPPGRRRAGLSA